MNKNTTIISALSILSTIILSACQSNISNHLQNLPQPNLSENSSTISSSQSRLDLAKNFPNMNGNTDLKPYLNKNHWINLFSSESPPPNSAINFNFNMQGENIRLNLNCVNPNEKPFFLIKDVNDVDAFSSMTDNDQRMEFVLDQQVFTNPFKDTKSKKNEKFKQAFYQAKKLTIKKYNLSKNPPEQNTQSTPAMKYSFNNQYADVLKEPSNHCDAID